MPLVTGKSNAQPIESVKEVNGIEEVTGNVPFDNNNILFDAKGFQPRTFSVIFKNKTLLTAPVNRFIDLPLTHTAVTTNAFNRSGNFDRRGNSFPAELMPEIIESEGVEFKVNNKPDEYNYIRCDGQTITLPETHGGGKLYLLVTSSNGNKKTTFDVDGKQYAFNIPYYSGFYGQWGWKGESEGYMHDASIAYLGTHRHNGKVGNESYTYTYLYKIAIDIDKNARTLNLPKNQSIALFAVTLSDNPNADTKSVHEMRALPHITKNIIYE